MKRRPSPPIDIACPDCGAAGEFYDERCARCGLEYVEETRRGARIGYARFRRRWLGMGSRTYDGILILGPEALYYLCLARTAVEVQVAGRSVDVSVRSRHVSVPEVAAVGSYSLDTRVMLLQGSIRIRRRQVDRIRAVRLGAPPPWYARLLPDTSWRGILVRATGASGRRKAYEFVLEDPDDPDVVTAFERIWGMPLEGA